MLMIAFAYPNVEVQAGNIDENTDLKVEKGEPARLVQIVCPIKAGEWDISSLVLQHLPNNFHIDLLVHRAVVTSAKELCMQHCGSPAKCMTLPNSLGKYLQEPNWKGETAALIFKLSPTEWRLLVLSIVLLLCIYSNKV